MKKIKHEDKDFSSHQGDRENFDKDKEDWKKFEQNNKEIALNILFVFHNEKEIEPSYISKYNYKPKKQVILLMITDDGKRWH